MNKAASYLTMMFLVCIFALCLVLPKGNVLAKDDQVFKDVKTTFWGYDAIQDIVGKGIAAGFGDGSFHPNESLTREQFAKLLVLSMDLDLVKTDKATYSDVKKTDWAFQYIETVKEYLEGYSFAGGKPFYDPKALITRQDVVVALIRGMGIKPENTSDEQSVKNKIKDYKQIPPQLLGYISAAIENNLITGYPDGTFKPNNSLNRASAAVFLQRVLKSPLVTPIKEIRLDLDIPIKTDVKLINISGTVDKNTLIYYGDKLITNNNGSIAKELSLDKGEGNYDLEFTAIKPNGRYKAITKKVLYVVPGPEVSMQLQEKSDSIKTTVTGHISDVNDRKPTILINDTSVAISENGDWITEVELHDGLNNIKLVAKNSFNKYSYLNKSVQFNAIAPLLTVDAVTETVNTPELTVSGKVTDINDVYPLIKLNNEILIGSVFTKKIILTEGINVLTFNATNKLGKSSVIVKKVNYIILPPQLTFTFFPDTTLDDKVTIQYNVNDLVDKEPKLYIDDINTYYSIPTSKVLYLKEGNNAYVFKAVNKFGKSFSITKTIKYIINPPVLVIDPLPEISLLKTITIKASATDLKYSLPKVYINNDYNYNSYSKTFTLTEGDNVFTFKATNSMGKTTDVITKTIKYLIPAPVLTVDNVPETSLVKSITLKAAATDSNDTSPKVYINNEYSNSEISKTVTLAEGDNIFVFKATNSLGKTSELISKTIRYVVPAPVLTIDAVPETSLNKTIILKAVAVDPNDASPKVYINNEYNLKEYSKTVTLNEGDNVFVFKATNSLGKTSELITKTIRYVVPAPILTVSETSITTNSSTITLIAEATDSNDNFPKLYVNDEYIQTKSFSKQFTLVEGDNVFIFKATNSSGKTSEIITKTIKYIILAPI